MLNTSKFYKIKDVLNDKSFKLQWKKALYDAGYIRRKPKEKINEDYDPPYTADQVKANYGLDVYKKLAKDPAYK